MMSPKTVIPRFKFHHGNGTCSVYRDEVNKCQFMITEGLRTYYIDGDDIAYTNSLDFLEALLKRLNTNNE